MVDFIIQGFLSDMVNMCMSCLSFFETCLTNHNIISFFRK